eukprot:scaffold259_cov252-Pinguiococcus_pyrenoidosus.AAC.16
MVKLLRRSGLRVLVQNANEPFERAYFSDAVLQARLLLALQELERIRAPIDGVLTPRQTANVQLDLVVEHLPAFQEGRRDGLGELAPHRFLLAFLSIGGRMMVGVGVGMPVHPAGRGSGSKRVPHAGLRASRGKQRIVQVHEPRCLRDGRSIGSVLRRNGLGHEGSQRD